MLIFDACALRLVRYLGDLEMLQCVGHPYAVRADPQLAAMATEKGWPQLQWEDPASPKLNLFRFLMQGSA